MSCRWRQSARLTVRRGGTAGGEKVCVAPVLGHEVTAQGGVVPVCVAYT